MVHPHLKGQHLDKSRFKTHKTFTRQIYYIVHKKVVFVCYYIFRTTKIHRRTVKKWKNTRFLRLNAQAMTKMK